MYHNSVCCLPPAGGRYSIVAQHSWRLSYLSSPLLRILYFSRNSECFCRRISVCFLKPLALGNSTEDTFRLSSIFKHHRTQRYLLSPNQCAHQTEEKQIKLQEFWFHSPGSLFGFIVNFCDDSIFLVHEVVVNFFQLP